MKYLIIMLLITATIGCSESSSDKPKDLFSLWASDSGDVLHLQSMQFDTWHSIAILDGTERCDCELQFTGSQSSGSYTYRNCHAVQGSAANCNVMDRTGSYLKTDSLTIQPASGPPQVYY